MDQNLLRLLYFLRGLSGEDRYWQAADDAIKWFLENAQSPTTGLLPWGEQMCWDAMADEAASSLEERTHEFSRPWMLWERCFELAPDETRRFALGLWKGHVMDEETGEFSAGADFDGASPRPAIESFRQAGFFIRCWAEAYAYTRDETFLRATDALVARYEKRRDPETGRFEFGSGPLGVCSALSMAIDCDGAARKVPEPLRTRLASLAASVDRSFLSLPHDLQDKHGFALSLGPTAAEHADPYSKLWEGSTGRNTTAAVAMMCVSRYENTGRVGYGELIVAAADAYMESLPGDRVDAWPMTFGHAIRLELAAFRVTARRKYYDRAVELAGIAVESFFGNEALPRASLKSDHYESTTGADTLVLALAELRLTTAHITAVRAPANTIDR
jgi:hypothetical protein